MIQLDFFDNDDTQYLKNEIKYLLGKGEERGLTIVPIRVYNKGRVIKMEIGIARGKKKYDKRETIKKRESKRKIERELKSSK